VSALSATFSTGTTAGSVATIAGFDDLAATAAGSGVGVGGAKRANALLMPSPIAPMRSGHLSEIERRQATAWVPRLDVRS
jgi:hypothetical protein